MFRDFIKKNLANTITSVRIFGTIVMVAVPTLSTTFFIAYIIAGISDAIDGFVARKMGTVSSFGSKLDSIADLFFYICMMIKILPELTERIPTIIFVIIVVIFTLRIIYYLVYAINFKQFLSNHTILNKITGFLMFFVPFLLLTKYISFYACLICVTAILGLVSDIIETKKSVSGDGSV